MYIPVSAPKIFLLQLLRKFCTYLNISSKPVMDPWRKDSDATEWKLFHYGLPDNCNNYFGYEKNQLLYSHCEICQANLMIFVSFFLPTVFARNTDGRLKYATFYNQETGNIKSTLKAIQKIKFRVALDCSYYRNGGGLTDTSPAALIRVLSPARPSTGYLKCRHKHQNVNRELFTPKPRSSY